MEQILSETASSDEIYKYFMAIGSESKEKSDWGLLNMAGCYQYGWHGISVDLERSAGFYNLLVEGQVCPRYRRKTYRRYAEVLLTLDNPFEASLMYAKLFGLERGEADGGSRCLKWLSGALSASHEMLSENNIEHKPISLEIAEEIRGKDLFGVSKADIADYYYRLALVASDEEYPQLAYNLYMESIEQGDEATTPWSWFAIGKLWMNTNKSPRKLKKNRKKAIEAFEAAISSGDIEEVRADAYWNLAWIEYYGFGSVLTDDFKALDYCEKSIELGHRRGYELKNEIERHIRSMAEGAAKSVVEDAYSSFLTSL